MSEISAGNGRGKIRLVARENLDRRTSASKQFDAIAKNIATDLGGEDRLSTVQKHLVECFAGCAIAVSDINARLLSGGEVDLLELAQMTSTLVRVATRIGVKRIPREIGPSLSDLIDEEPADHG
jgi:hypothetical protein